MNIIEIPVEKLKPYERNPRKNAKAVEKVAESITQFGFVVPMFVTKDKVIVTGHTRLEAAKKIGMETVPCIVIDDLDQDEIDQYRIVDNKTGELSVWDFEKLVIELAGIEEIDMSAFGFGDQEEPTAAGQKMESNKEIAMGDYDDNQFDFECPHCGFRWNE